MDEWMDFSRFSRYLYFITVFFTAHILLEPYMYTNIWIFYS